MSAALQRQHLQISRAAEYFSARELAAQTGQPVSEFLHVILKELVDNALDASETAKVAPVVTLDVQFTADELVLSITDNGPGIPPDVVSRILDFSTRTSDKIAWRSPTRGAQGNALKTVLGISFALGADRSLIEIAACGVRHRIEAWLTPAGEVRIQHDPEECSMAGTAITVTVPHANIEHPLAFDPQGYVRAFALLNPHVSVKITVFDYRDEHAKSVADPIADIYPSTVAFPNGWRKFLPTDLTSPHWYDPDAFTRLVHLHIAHSRRRGHDLPLRPFVRQFRGLSGSAKAKAVCARLPLSRLAELEEKPALIDTLFEALRSESTPPKPDVLGTIGETHFRQRFEVWFGVRRFWYQRTIGSIDGIPYVFEVALAETEETDRLFHGVNFSPTFDDPLSNTRLPCDEFDGYGFKSFLSQGYALGATRHTVAAMHLVCPVLQFLDRGKSRLNLPTAMAKAIGQALWRVVKDLYREEKKRRRDAAKAERDYERAVNEERKEAVTIKSAVFAVVLEAVDTGTGHGTSPISSRSLFYQVRPLIQRYTDRELDYNYFSQNLLVEYQQRHQPISALYYDPRGVLYEPHTGRSVPLGTREVEAYEFPSWRYNKVLYIEKKGLWPVIEAAKLAERYDMAVVAAEGYASTAVRTLFANADRQHGYRLFVLHDCDPDGYGIARTLAEGTRRMPNHRIEVVDLGLRLDEARAMNLQSETYARKKALPEALALTEEERAFFTGRQVGRRQWIAERIELNAMTGPQLISFIETKLAEAGATNKVIPGTAALAQATQCDYRRLLTRQVRDEIEYRLNFDTLIDTAVSRLGVLFPLQDAEDWIRRAFDKNCAVAWDRALATELQERIGVHTDQIKRIVEEIITEATK